MPCLLVYSKATRDKWQIRVEREHVMVVGTCKITLHIPESHTLKDKRQVLRSLMSRVRQTFEVSIAEVDNLDRWQAATLGVAVVSNDARHADEVIAILSESTPIKSRDIYKSITPTGMNPDGRVNAESLAYDLAFYASQGLIKDAVKLDQVIDNSFVEAALKDLGPYKP